MEFRLIDSNNYGAPLENIRIYDLLYAIEIGLREYIIETLTATFGPKWWSQYIPDSMLEKWNVGHEAERRIKWLQVIPHHPIYYADFPHLREIIMFSQNWKHAFVGEFGKNREVIIGMLSQLEPIRNRIAHNRRATEADLHVVSATYDQISSIIGHEHFATLISVYTSAPDIPEQIKALKTEAENAFKCCEGIQLLEDLPIWEGIKSTWWLDATYLGHEINSILAYFTDLDWMCPVKCVNRSKRVILPVDPSNRRIIESPSVAVAAASAQIEGSVRAILR